MPLGRFHGVAVFLGDTDTSSRTNGGSLMETTPKDWRQLGSSSEVLRASRDHDLFAQTIVI